MIVHTFIWANYNRWLLLGDVFQAIFRLLGVVLHDLQIGLEILPQVGLIEDRDSRIAREHISLGVFETQDTLAADYLLQVERT